MKDFLLKKGISADDYSKLPAGEALELMNEFNAIKQKALNEAIEAKASKEDILELKAEILKQKDAQFDQLQEALKLQGIALKKLSSEEVEGKEVSFKQSLRSKLDSNIEGLKRLKNSSSAADNVKFDVKAVGDMSLAGNVTGQVPQALRISGLNSVPSRVVRLLDIVSGGTIGSNLVEWVYQANKEGAAGATAESAAKNQIDFDLLVGSQKVEKTTAFITVTDEMLDDVDFIESAINNELTKELLKAVETGVFGGSGVSPQMNGIFTVAPAFAAGVFAGTVDNANSVDVLSVAMDQIMIAQEGSAVPNYILMHPSDVTALKMVKVSSTDKRYVERLAMVGGELSLDGVPIIPTTLVTVDKYLVGDFSKASVLTKQSVSIEVGYNADNFVKNYKTIRAEWRGVTFVKNNDRSAFVAGDFSTNTAALETA
jgi:HK97 family phage major capsid protein